MMSNLEEIIGEFKKSQNFQRIEELADIIGDIGDRRAIEPLLYRLGDTYVQEDPDVEDAVCEALVKLGVMRKIGNLNYKFLDKTLLSDDVLRLLEKYKILIPRKYI